MQYLHAHWRMDYVKQPKDQRQRRSPFLAALASPDRRASLLLWRDECAFILLNRYPYNPGHLLVLPIREVAELEELSPDEQAGFFQAMIRAKGILQRAMNPDGFNVGLNLGSAAGAGIPRHLHCHVVPRWDGDTNFMPILADTKVLPQALEDLYDQLLQFA